MSADEEPVSNDEEPLSAGETGSPAGDDEPQNPIPDYNKYGVVPPLLFGEANPDPNPYVSRIRTPYRATMLEFVQRFSYSKRRIDIVRGLLQFRSRLREAGFNSGDQWLNGSYVENSEVTRGGTHPNDIDVVTLVVLGSQEEQTNLVQNFPDLFSPGFPKARYKVDAYFLDLEPNDGSSPTYDVTYWYSMWSHRKKDLLWKGFVVVNLNCDDAKAAEWLDKKLELLEAAEANQPQPDTEEEHHDPE